MLMQFFILEQEDFSILIPAILWRVFFVVWMTEWRMQNKNFLFLCVPLFALYLSDSPSLSLSSFT